MQNLKLVQFMLFPDQQSYFPTSDRPTERLSSIPHPSLTSIEICAGAGGQAIGLELAGFEHLALVEIDKHACTTLKANRPNWNVLPQDLRDFSAKEFKGIDLFAGGVPCPPFSKAGKQLGTKDERNLFPEALRLISEAKPRAVMLENVRGLLDESFAGYRKEITDELNRLGYKAGWKLLNASDFGVPQLRPRVVLIALRTKYAANFFWPAPVARVSPTVGQTLKKLMGSNGWAGAESWSQRADRIAPTLVGGSKKHGGPDLGPTRAKKAWAELGVNGKGLANEPPSADFDGVPKLTVDMAALIQGFPAKWKFQGGKTASYRQVGNAFPPPVARAVGLQIRAALLKATKTSIQSEDSVSRISA